MDHVRHGMIFPLGIPCRDQPELIHEIHKFGNVCLSFQIPDRCRMATGLISPVNNRGNNGRSHGFQFLGSHQTSRILRPHDVHRHTNVGTGVQNLAIRYSNRIFIKYFLHRSEALYLMRNLSGRCIYGLQFNPQGGCGKALQLLAKHDRIGSSGLYVFDFLRS